MRLLRRLLSCFNRSVTAPVVVNVATPVESAPPLPVEHVGTAPVPAFIKPVAFSTAESQTKPHEHHDTASHQNRDPGRAIGRLRSGAAGSGHRGSAGAWPAADAGTAGSGGLEIFPELEAETFIAGVFQLEHRNGAEHDVRFDPATGRVIKLTQPGEFGAWGGLEEYDGAWIHAQREIVISDALSKNFVLDVAGHVHPIDLIILAPDDEQWERLQNMARNYPQHQPG